MHWLSWERIGSPPRLDASCPVMAFIVVQVSWLMGLETCSLHDARVRVSASLAPTASASALNGKLLDEHGLSTHADQMRAVHCEGPQEHFKHLDCAGAANHCQQQQLPQAAGRYRSCPVWPCLFDRMAFSPCH
jgi:hypothetical protein